MVTICLKCGDRGFSVALIYCGKCLANALHRYCLDAWPVTVDEYVTWFCEDCESKLRKLSIISVAILVPSRQQQDQDDEDKNDQ